LPGRAVMAGRRDLREDLRQLRVFIGRLIARQNRRLSPEQPARWWPAKTFFRTASFARLQKPGIDSADYHFGRLCGVVPRGGDEGWRPDIRGYESPLVEVFEQPDRAGSSRREIAAGSDARLQGFGTAAITIAGVELPFITLPTLPLRQRTYFHLRGAARRGRCDGLRLNLHHHAVPRQTP
jgi:hypothetical protein